MTILRTVATGSGAIDAAHLVPQGQHYRLLSVAVRLSAAPTTSESLNITLNSEHGAEYDTLLYTINPAAQSATNVFWQPDHELYLWPGDAVGVKFANTDARIYGVTIMVGGA